MHDHDSIWIARWIDKLTGKEKYVWPHESADIQQSRNKEKYDKSLRIGNNLERIRAKIIKTMSSKEQKISKVATVCYLIDALGMRVGDEKDEDEADTVGATTLRVEHVKIDGAKVEFDFLGKDSVRWLKILPNPPEVLVGNLRKFMSGKKPDQEIFNGVNSGGVNRFLSSTLEGVTAKVFRTYHATSITQRYLMSVKVDAADELEKLYHAKKANLEAARWCNHKRTPPKNWDEAYQKKLQKLKEYEEKGKESLARKMRMNVELTAETKEYNLNTSLKNYIDPRVFKAWFDFVGLDWKKLYTSSLQRKFGWISNSKKEWKAEPVAPVPLIKE